VKRPLVSLAGVALLAIFACTQAAAQSSTAAPPAPGITTTPSTTSTGADALAPAVAQQIAAISAVKAGFSPAQTKMSSHLAFGILAASNDPSVASFADAIAPVGDPEPAGFIGPHQGGRLGLNKPVTINIFGEVSDALLNAIAAAQGTVLYQSAQWGVVVASVPLGAVTALAARSDVSRIRQPGRMYTNADSRGSGSRTLDGERVNGTPHTNVGLVTSQGYIAHEANKVVNNFGITGAGVTVGVLSDSASDAEVAHLISTGDLPPGTHSLPGQAEPSNSPPGEDEGTAMMEIIHDMAPGANLIFATAFTSDFSFADNIIALQQAGCKVIVDDVSYSEEGVFQDSTIAQAVNIVTAAGSIYFSAAANSGNLTKGTSGTWEGDFLSGGAVTGPITAPPFNETGLFHNFGGGTPQNYDVLTGATVDITLKWSDPLGASTNDYDLYLLNAAGTAVVDFSAGSQTGTQDPIEEIFNGVTGYAAGSRVVVVLFSGAKRALHVDTNRGLLSINTSGATVGHNAGLNTVTMAATYWDSALGGTQPFTGFANVNEGFSSDGPRKIFFNPDGTAITPGNFLFGTNGGTTLIKPDMAAADGVTTLTPGFNPFFGTSAAAPHAASIAALILSARPDYSIAQIKNAMTATALDSMAPGIDRDSGYGIAMARAAVQYALTH
jgi:hypothetical protein